MLLQYEISAWSVQPAGSNSVPIGVISVGFYSQNHYYTSLSTRPDFSFSFVILNDFEPVWIVRIPKENSAKKMKKSNTIRNFCKSVRGQ